MLMRRFLGHRLAGMAVPAAALLSVAGLALAACASQPPSRSEPAAPMRFLCDRGMQVTIAFTDDRATVTSPNGSVVMAAAPAGSGYAYVDGERSIRGKGHELTWTSPERGRVHCREEQWAMRQPQVQPSEPGLLGTRWTLVAFQSSDDAIGKIVPPSVERYVLAFEAEGRLALQLDCNRANGQWSVTSSSADGGALVLRAGAMTRAACQQGALDGQIARDLMRVRSFTRRENRLFLALEADAGVYEFQRAP
jgi:heat shock protein HslJ/membrane-bound inhibitor of C-type lysozyme